MGSCTRHTHERSVSPCRRCGAAWCGDCLVYAFGGKKLPYCMSCAMFAGGIRTVAARPAMSKREVRKLLKATKLEDRSGLGQTLPESEPVVPAVGAPAPEPGISATSAGEPSMVHVAAAATDWEKPWWEERQPTYVD